MRLFRQKAAGQWAPVFDRMAEELAKMVEKRPASPSIRVDISPGELMDKLTILRIKAERIEDPQKLRNVKIELETLEKTREKAIAPSAEFDKLVAELKAVNEELWEIEDNIRDCERQESFKVKFVKLARSVYRLNDRRAGLKRQINELLGSRLIEEKAYKPY